MSQKQSVRPQNESRSGRQVSCDASTEQKSIKFLKQMIALQTSHIVYLRGIFDEHEFKDRFIGDLKIKMLRDKESDENIHLLIEWLKGCFDALEKKYLKSVTLTIHDPEQPRDNAIESYTFSVSYKDDQVGSLSMHRNGKQVSDESFSEKSLKEASTDCLTKLCDAVEVLDVLPDEVVLNMELAYYDDRTPDDYEPEGFRPSEAKPKAEALEVGGIETKFHCLRVKVYTREFADLSRMSASRTSLNPGTSQTSLLSPSLGANPTGAAVGVISPTVRNHTPNGAAGGDISSNPRTRKNIPARRVTPGAKNEPQGSANSTVDYHSSMADTSIPEGGEGMIVDTSPGEVAETGAGDAARSNGPASKDSKKGYSRGIVRAGAGGDAEPHGASGGKVKSKSKSSGAEAQATSRKTDCSSLMIEYLDGGDEDMAVDQEGDKEELLEAGKTAGGKGVKGRGGKRKAKEDESEMPSVKNSTNVRSAKRSRR